MRTFETGATRNTDQVQDPEGFLSPLVIQRYIEYMAKHRVQVDGVVRASDNWQKGLPLDTYMKSGWRHFLDWWLEHRGYSSRDGLEDALCGLMFNTMGYLYELLKAEDDDRMRREFLKRMSEGMSEAHRPSVPLVDEQRT